MTTPFLQSAAGFMVMVTIVILVTIGGLVIKKIVNIDV